MNNKNYAETTAKTDGPELQSCLIFKNYIKGADPYDIDHVVATCYMGEDIAPFRRFARMIKKIGAHAIAGSGNPVDTEEVLEKVVIDGSYEYLLVNTFEVEKDGVTYCYKPCEIMEILPEHVVPAVKKMLNNLSADVIRICREGQTSETYEEDVLLLDGRTGARINDAREKKILGSILIDRSILPEISDVLSSDLFDGFLNREIYLSAAELFRASAPVDCAAVYMHVRSKDNVHVSEEHLKSYLEKLMNCVTLADKDMVVRLAEDIRNEKF